MRTQKLFMLILSVIARLKIVHARPQLLADCGLCLVSSWQPSLTRTSAYKHQSSHADPAKQVLVQNSYLDLASLVFISISHLSNLHIFKDWSSKASLGFMAIKGTMWSALTALARSACELTFYHDCCRSKERREYWLSFCSNKQTNKSKSAADKAKKTWPNILKGFFWANGKQQKTERKKQLIKVQKSGHCWPWEARPMCC